jgi:hypothetical protein
MKSRFSITQIISDPASIQPPQIQIQDQHKSLLEEYLCLLKDAEDI